MSIKQMTMVWELDVPQSQQGLLLALADHADDDGTKCFPSVAYLAWKLGCTPRTVFRIMKDLKKAGLLEAVAWVGGGRGHTVEYILHLEKGDKKSPFRETANPDISVTLSGETNPDTSVTLSEETLTPVSLNPDTSVTPTIINRQEEEEKDSEQVRTCSASGRFHVTDEDVEDPEEEGTLDEEGIGVEEFFFIGNPVPVEGRDESEGIISGGQHPTSGSVPDSGKISSKGNSLQAENLVLEPPPVQERKPVQKELMPKKRRHRKHKSDEQRYGQLPYAVQEAYREVFYPNGYDTDQQRAMAFSHAKKFIQAAEKHGFDDPVGMMDLIARDLYQRMMADPRPGYRTPTIVALMERLPSYALKAAR